MTLAEALRASKIRKARALIFGASSDRPITVVADDNGVIYTTTGGHCIEKSWIDVTIEDRLMLQSAVWVPTKSKHPLVQLADTLTDWTDD